MEIDHGQLTTTRTRNDRSPASKPQLGMPRNTRNTISFRLAQCLRCMEALLPTGVSITIITIPIIILGLALAKGRTDPDLDARHRVLSDFLGRGQLTVDLFPPLSYFLRGFLPSWAHVVVNNACLQVMVHLVFWDSSSAAGRSSARWRCAMSIFSWLAILMTGKAAAAFQNESALETSSALAACLVLLALLPGLTPGWLGQILVIVAGRLGCNPIDWKLCYAVVTARTLTSLVSDTPSTRSSSPRAETRLACHMGFALIRAACMPLLVSTTIYALLFPYSETSTGGNHNLHFLDSISRRALHPSEPVTLSALGLSRHEKYIPKHAIIPYLPLSLYVPNAGFLWADPDELDAMSDGVDEAESQTGVFFSDPFGTRYPWALEEPEPPGKLDAEEREFVESHIWPGALVYLRSRIDHRYLAAVEEKDPVHGDEMMDDEYVGSFKRLQVGMRDEPSAETVWILDYDPDRDAGFSLYNPNSECHLSTTFRKYGITTSNGTVEDGFQKEFEASCTRGVSKPASTIWIIEGHLVHDAQAPDLVSKPLAAWRDFAAWFQRGLNIRNAHASLSGWQRRYAQKLEMPLSPLSSSQVRNTWGLWFEKLTFGVFLGIHALYMLVGQRTSRKSRVDWSLVTSAALFCWAHVLSHSVFGYARPYGAEVALVIAMRGLRELLCDIGEFAGFG